MCQRAWGKLKAWKLGCLVRVGPKSRKISTGEQNAVKTVTKSAKAKFAKVLYKIHNFLYNKKYRITSMCIPFNVVLL